VVGGETDESVGVVFEVVFGGGVVFGCDLRISPLLLPVNQGQSLLLSKSKRVNTYNTQNVLHTT